MKSEKIKGVCLRSCTYQNLETSITCVGNVHSLPATSLFYLLLMLLVGSFSEVSEWDRPVQSLPTARGSQIPAQLIAQPIFVLMSHSVPLSLLVCLEGFGEMQWAGLLICTGKWRRQWGNRCLPHCPFSYILWTWSREQICGTCPL